MFKQLGSLLSRKRVRLNKSSINSLFHFDNCQQSKGLPNYHDRKFSTIFNKQFNKDENNTEPDFYTTQVTKEQLVKIIDLKVVLSSPAFDKTRLDQLDQKIKKNQREFPEKALPSEILGELVKGIMDFSIFMFVNRSMEQDKYELIENLDEMKRQAVYLMLKFSTFNCLLIKGVYQEWFSFEDLKNMYPPVSHGIDIEGKDIVTI
ncbi:predicted protein [Naegleria gruberi]|uniref:Predicted protein n=1 Tax=Naegleria gruberi TaxID=5762 RepID=D2VXG5_NAEGR|nr:uncharacterized protein NAEGRDRAFT_73739 [Naegleria gruberi]EFC38436.1 predicted protein [Naegleria gruberi]|eukprot:XP_002671180.1 predicted protein [Naegleria gruberi strain NEG-M]